MKGGRILHVLGESLRASTPQPKPSNPLMAWDVKLLDARERANRALGGLNGPSSRSLDLNG